MDNQKLFPILVSILILFVIAGQAMFIVDQRQTAIVLQLGEPVGEPRGPGLHLKIPIVQSVRFFDSRILSVDPSPDEMVISASTKDLLRYPELNQAEEATTEEGEEEAYIIEDVTGEPIIVDTFARYKIVDPLRFMKTLVTIRGANLRLERILNDATRAVLGKTTLKQLLSTERADVMNDIRARVNKKTKEDNLGIEIVDVRIVRADLTADLRTSTVRRMISELKERATETRAKGEENALAIRSKAEKERTVLIAEAQRDSEIIKGQGDEQAITTYAEAFNKDKDFYSFIRSMEAYRNTLANPDTRLILSPDSQFFRHFQNGRSAR
ncbi:MAG: protease modulator HflC [Pseudomonadota bacterium]